MQTGYIATVIDQYGGELYDQAVESLHQTIPGITWIEPARAGWSLIEWYRHWSELLPGLDVLAVIPRPGGSIGRGVWQEITDCQRRHIPIYVLIGGEWITSFEVERWPGESYRYWAEVRKQHGA